MKRLSIRLLVLMFGSAVTDCATTQPSVYAHSKPRDAAEQFNKDGYSRVYMACMTQRGYMIG
jgi:hypothetical protein